MKKSAADEGQWPTGVWNFVVFCYKIQQNAGFHFSTKATISPLTGVWTGKTSSVREKHVGQR